MRNIPDAHVEQIYRQEYWNKVSGDELPSGVDHAVFDWGVNSGTGRSARALQRIVVSRLMGHWPNHNVCRQKNDAARLLRPCTPDDRHFMRG